MRRATKYFVIVMSQRLRLKVYNHRTAPPPLAVVLFFSPLAVAILCAKLKTYQIRYKHVWVVVVVISAVHRETGSTAQIKKKRKNVIMNIVLLF